jgi:hypothetical protein
MLRVNEISRKTSFDCLICFEKQALRHITAELEIISDIQLWGSILKQFCDVNNNAKLKGLFWLYNAYYILVMAKQRFYCCQQYSIIKKDINIIYWPLYVVSQTVKMR